MTMQPVEFYRYQSLMSDDDLPDLTDLLTRPAWMADAACREHPELDWHPPRGTDVRPLKAVCAGCLVRDECLAFALEHDQREGFGVWGGVTPVGRRKMDRKRTPVTAPCDGCGDPCSTPTGLCTACRRYRWKYGRLPSPETLATRARRRAS